MKYVHTNIISEDWRKLSEFYIKVFGCKIVPALRKQEGEWLSEGTGVKEAKLEGVHLLLPGYGEKGPTLEIYQYGKIEKQKLIAPNQSTKRNIEGVGIITFIYVRDPDGNLIELQSWKKE